MSIHADTLEGALSGNLLSYIGSIFTILFGLIVIIDMCHKRFYFGIRFSLVIFATILGFLLATTKESQLFFKAPYIVKEHGLTLIKFKMGPGMFMYMAFLGGVNLSAIIVVITSIFTKKNVSKKSLQILLCALILGTLAYIIPMVAGTRLNLMPYIYLVLEILFLYYSAKTNTYDLQLNLINILQNRTGYGYIAFDNKKRFLGCNDFALTFFPKLKEISLDSYIPEDFSNIIENLRYADPDWDWNEHCNEDFKIQFKDRAGICTIHKLSASRMKMGFFLELRDDTEQQNYINGLNSFNKELSHLVKEKTEQVTDMQDSIIRGIATMVESRDNSTGGHILRTSDCIQIFAEELLKHKEIKIISPEFCKLLVKAAPMHDLGKIAVDDSILRKPGKFTPEEYEKMKEHPAKGAVIVEKVLTGIDNEDFRKIAVNVAHYHHEKWDGTGYPEKLRGEAIPLEARIMALADVFDALVSKRCYKDSFSYDKAFQIIEESLGTHFDPELGKQFIACRPKLEQLYDSYN
jgi:HD-GYP domain-containing protein (c-di-GMP phosphodiesterase class II)